MAILKDENNSVVRANIVSEVPSGYEDITSIVVNPEYLDEVALEYIDLQIVPAVEEVQAEPAYWSNGEDTVYDSNDIPTVEDGDGNAILDPAYIKTDAIEYVAAEPQKYMLIKKANADQDIATQAVQEIVKAAIVFGNSLVVDFATENVILGITADGMTKAVRQKMSEITSALQTGSLYDAIDEIDSFPEEDKDDKYITDERLQSYKTKILEYLGA